MIFDQGSICGQNIEFIAKQSGNTRYSVMNMSPIEVANSMSYFPTPKDSLWKVTCLMELLEVRDGDLQIGDDQDEGGFSKEEIQTLINFISTN